MSYNIDNFRVKEIKDFIIPNIHELLENDLPEVFDITFSEDTLIITDLSIYGECSGHFWNDIFLNYLKNSTGYLKALMDWEGGDTIEWLTVKDGEIKLIDVYDNA